MIKKTIKVIHLASFFGNIGDCANHQGFYSKLKKLMSVEINQIEIRKYYKNRNELNFDNSFVDLVNQHDLLILGGGGFFDLKWGYSQTGTTLDFSDEIIEQIKVPVLVNAMGYHEYGVVDKVNVTNFRNFLKNVVNNKKWMVTVRNDGSLDRLKKRYGSLVRTVKSVPDSGFVYNPQMSDKCGFDTNSTKWIGINITNELFSKQFNKDISVDGFNSQISTLIGNLLDSHKGYKIMLFPHAYNDLTTITSVLENVDDKYKRESIAVAPLFAGGKTVDVIFDLYRLCECVVAMRFHGNVCPIGMGIPTIGLAGHEQIMSLYKEIGILDRCVVVDNINFKDELIQKIDLSLKNKKQIQNKYKILCDNINRESDTYFANISNFLHTNLV